ncbi:hypothetical protein ACFE04_012047 [Oxalis oulophora]
MALKKPAKLICFLIWVIMRFEKGSKVEVFNAKEFPSGAWQRAVIVSGNGHNYTVKFDCFRESYNESVVHKVSNKIIRPLPPPVSHGEGLKAGDVVEVFDDSSWKIAMVLNAMNGNLYFIRLVGSSRQFHVHKGSIRVRQCWQDEEWVLIGKGSGWSEVTKSDYVAVQKKSCYQESYNVSDQSLKRASPSYSYAESYTRNSKKTREIEQDGEDFVSLNNRMNKHYVVVRDTTSCVAECSHLSTEASEDAESFDLRGNEEEECHNGLGESVAGKIHSLELHAYRCTLEAFYASGPLSWEQEALLTNLRFSLHISNDEHLIEVRNLISGTSRDM